MMMQMTYDVAWESGRERPLLFSPQVRRVTWGGCILCVATKTAPIHCPIVLQSKVECSLV